MPRILLIQGPNMSYLGRRQPELYGTTTAAELDAMVLAHARTLGCSLEILYTHHEGVIIERLYEAADDGVDGLLMNPAALLFAGYALRDCLRALAPRLPYVEVHMTNIEKRGIHSILAETAVGMVAGFGVRSYLLGLEALLGHLAAAPGTGKRTVRRRGTPAAGAQPAAPAAAPRRARKTARPG